MTMHYSQHQKAGGECRPGAHREEDTVGAREDDAGGEGGDAGTERSGEGLLERWRIDGILRWCRRAGTGC